MLAGMAATGLPKDWRNALPAASLLLFRPFERVIEERWASPRSCAASRAAGCCPNLTEQCHVAHCLPLLA